MSSSLAVQWMRERFNECLDRAQAAKNKCEDENGGNACVEKLLYDRALEMVGTLLIID
jgi:serine/threonine-protein kinase ULK/ATG1